MVLRDDSDAVVARLDAAQGTLLDVSRVAVVTVSPVGLVSRTADGAHICACEGYASTLLPVVALLFVFMQPTLLANHGGRVEGNLALSPDDFIAIASAATAARAAVEPTSTTLIGLSLYSDRTNMSFQSYKHMNERTNDIEK
jgi:hypothetical protein